MSLNAYDDDYDDDRRPLKRIILCVVGIALTAVLWFVIRPSLGSGGTTSASTFYEPAATTDVVEQELVPTTTSTVPPTTASEDPATTVTSEVEATTTTAAGRTDSGPDSGLPTTSATDSSIAPGDTALGETEAQVEQVASYPTLPDGSPTPVLAIFDTDQITLSGTVPSQAAADRLAQLAIANSKTTAPLVQFLAINPDVPANVGVRVIEMTSSRFPAGGAEILPDHGRELDRIGAVMNALPNTTVLVIGHADQRGSEEDNFAVSEARARAVVSHLVDYGIDASRLSSRAVGESDLLSLNDDETALELNRRTEFVIYGTLLGA
ncbi:MAG TPA: OmpA family protein [Ilumatobacteraceae bacterium]|nr:OmpA family protein [Ilumatobacteraceae bacterium]